MGSNVRQQAEAYCDKKRVSNNFARLLMDGDGVVLLDFLRGSSESSSPAATEPITDLRTGQETLVVAKGFAASASIPTQVGEHAE